MNSVEPRVNELETKLAKALERIEEQGREIEVLKRSASWLYQFSSTALPVVLAVFIAAFAQSGRFDEVSSRFSDVSNRFDDMNQRFTAVDSRMGSLEQRVGGVEQDVKSLLVAQTEMKRDTEAIKQRQEEIGKDLKTLLARLQR
jgi:chromosome segregation ATPase